MGTIGGNLLQATRCWYWRLEVPVLAPRRRALPREVGRAPRARHLRQRALRFGAPVRPCRRARRARRPAADDASASWRSRSSTASRPTTTAPPLPSARRADPRARRSRTGGEHLPEGHGPQGVLVPARRRRRRPHRRRDATGAVRRRADPVAARLRRTSSRPRRRCPAPPTRSSSRARSSAGRWRRWAREALAPARLAVARARGLRRRGRRRRERLDGHRPPSPTDVREPARLVQPGRLRRSRRQEGGDEKPTELPAGKQPELVVETNCGTFTIELDPEAAPKTVASVAGLAEAGFYDETTFHRIVPGFVIQGGDPTATGTRRPRLLDRRHARGDDDVHEGRRGDGEDADGGAGHRRAASSSS